MNVTFFGHRDAPQEIAKKLETALIEVIEHDGADTFYVGNQGNFDVMVRQTLQKLKKIYPQIEYAAVLAYMPGSCKEDKRTRDDPTIYPEGLEQVPQKFAISKRNDWLIEHSDLVIIYTRDNFGYADKWKECAKKRGKRLINLAGETDDTTK